jgi:hypothetical protein
MFSGIFQSIEGPSMCQRCLRFVGLLLVTLLALPALDITGDSPTYLANTLTPAWRLVPLATVLDAINKTTGNEMTRSQGISEAGEEVILLSTMHAVSIKDTLALLEQCAAVCFTVSNGLLSAETKSEYDVRRIETRWYELSDYALIEGVSDAAIKTLGLSVSSGLTDGKPIAYSEESVARDPDELIEFIQYNLWPKSWEVEGIGIQQRGSHLIIAQTPEIHEQIHSLLAKLKEQAGHSKRWQVTFGLLAKGKPFPTGIVSANQAKDLNPQLTNVVVLTLSGLLGQLVQSSQLEERSYTLTLDVVNSHLDVRPQAIRLGRSAAIRAYAGQRFSLLSTYFAWVEEIEKNQTSTVRSPAHAHPVNTTTVTPANTGSVTTTTSNPATIAGEQITLDHPALWTWRPSFDCFLPKDSALILTSEHPRGNAVMVVEELP